MWRQRSRPRSNNLKRAGTRWSRMWERSRSKIWKRERGKSRKWKRARSKSQEPEEFRNKRRSQKRARNRHRSHRGKEAREGAETEPGIKAVAGGAKGLKARNI